MNKTEEKRETEKKTISLMISIYCRKKHKDRKKQAVKVMNGKDAVLCPECAKLHEYALMRIEKCPFMETKTFCSRCKVHCYKPEMLEKIKKVMRFSGPRMMLSHPVMVIKHALSAKD